MELRSILELVATVLGSAGGLLAPYGADMPFWLTLIFFFVGICSTVAIMVYLPMFSVLIRAWLSYLFLVLMAVLLPSKCRERFSHDFRPSAIYVSPLLREPNADWLMLNRHYGPEPAYNPSYDFTNLCMDNGPQWRKSYNEFDPTEDDSYDHTFTVPECARYLIRGTTRGSLFNEDIRIQHNRTTGRFDFEIVWNDQREDGATAAFHCRDTDFPLGLAFTISSERYSILPSCGQFRFGPHQGILAPFWPDNPIDRRNKLIVLIYAALSLSTVYMPLMLMWLENRKRV
jgi:hypothetical protein